MDQYDGNIKDHPLFKELVNVVLDWAKERNAVVTNYGSRGRLLSGQYNDHGLSDGVDISGSIQGNINSLNDIIDKYNCKRADIGYICDVVLHLRDPLTHGDVNAQIESAAGTKS